MASVLSSKGYSVAILEKTDYTNFRTGETLPPKINTALHSLSINENIFLQQLPSNATMSSWGSSSVIENNLLLNPFGNGWHLNRSEFDRALIEHAGSTGSQLFLNSKIESIHQNSRGNWHFIIKTNNGNVSIQSRFAVDASGRNSILIKKMGGKRIIHDHLIAVISIQKYEPGENNSNYTLIESVENGWWYSADLPGNKIVFSYMTDADLYKAEVKKSENAFLRKHSETRFIKERLISGFSNCINVTAANSYIMDTLYGWNWVSVGDSAMAYDPLSSSGVLRSINDGIKAANSIQDYFNNDTTALKNLADNYMQKYQEYLTAKSYYYQLEKRWPDSIFWNRRDT